MVYGSWALKFEHARIPSVRLTIYADQDKRNVQLPTAKLSILTRGAATNLDHH